MTIDPVRQPGSTRFTHGFLIVRPGLTIRDQRPRQLLRRSRVGSRRHARRARSRQGGSNPLAPTKPFNHSRSCARISKSPLSKDENQKLQG
jgi:hypothetical protein